MKKSIIYSLSGIALAYFALSTALIAYEPNELIHSRWIEHRCERFGDTCACEALVLTQDRNLLTAPTFAFGRSPGYDFDIRFPDKTKPT